ncbi:hypothetical protein [Umezakia ovalisporum]|jgi:hypothetical protein|uniref:hypothetical protein n=1 Tax=Umezakia ovalisporum TaxID=75695 RepID=UPI0006EF37E6|nr:hypothetical protein [Umezakia ovalisporum]MDH6070671.1 hypothetical protein [Umezakia ovalisporum CobakiLakeA]CEJ43816.1 Uncharacterized protein apha_01015 [Umezakia ovalisporum]
MEDYQVAFLERHLDTETLDPISKIRAMHFGGITIEYLIKAIICNTLPGVTGQNLRTHSHTELLIIFQKSEDGLIKLRIQWDSTS